MGYGQNDDIKTYQVPDLYPARKYSITFCDSDHQPVKNILFYYSPDGEDQRSATTDEAGRLSAKVSKRASLIRVSVA